MNVLKTDAHDALSDSDYSIHNHLAPPTGRKTNNTELKASEYCMVYWPQGSRSGEEFKLVMVETAGTK